MDERAVEKTWKLGWGVAGMKGKCLFIVDSAMEKNVSGVRGGIPRMDREVMLGRALGGGKG